MRYLLVAPFQLGILHLHGPRNPRANVCARITMQISEFRNLYCSIYLKKPSVEITYINWPKQWSLSAYLRQYARATNEGFDRTGLGFLRTPIIIPNMIILKICQRILLIISCQKKYNLFMFRKKLLVIYIAFTSESSMLTRGSRLISWMQAN